MRYHCPARNLEGNERVKNFGKRETVGKDKRKRQGGSSERNRKERTALIARILESNIIL